MPHPSDNLPLRTANILTASLQQGDATSNHAFDLLRVLNARQIDVRLYCHRTGTLPDDVQPCVQVVQTRAELRAADLTIVEYATWFPLAEALRQNAEASAIFWYHGVTPPALWGIEEGQDILRNDILRTELAWFAHLAVTASPFTQQELHAHARYPLERIRVVPLAVPLNTFQQLPTPDELAKLRRQWHLDEKQVLLYVGRVAGNKRLDLLLEALAKVAARQPNVHLILVGDTSSNSAARTWTDRLREQALRLGIRDRITFTGRVPAIEPYMHLASAVVLPSQHEGFGVPLVEAMAAGTPTIASSSGAMPWVLQADQDKEKDGQQAAGLLFTPGDADDLAHKIGQLCTDQELVNSLIQQGKARAEHFAPNHFAARVWQAITAAVALAQQGPAPAATHFGTSPLYQHADVALRSYQIESQAPLLGPLIGWLRRNSTTHIKEAYLDRIIEQQVNYNRLLADEVMQLRAELAELRQQVAELQKRVE